MSVLQDALRKAQDDRDRSRGIQPAARPGRAANARSGNQRRPAARAAASPLAALALTAVIFTAVLLLWHRQPELHMLAPLKPPAPGALKLDYTLDLGRQPEPAPGTPPR